MRIWLIDHYSVPPKYYPLARQTIFAKHLMKMGHEVLIIAASTVHNSSINLIEGKEEYIELTEDGVKYLLIKCRQYSGNGLRRMANMLEFADKLPRVCAHLEKPDAILSCSMTLFACAQGLRLSERYGCRKIAQITDLWPETIVAYGMAGPRHPLVVMLRMLEKWIYTHADTIIFSMEGAYDYILARGWEKAVPREKVCFINNGVDLEAFEENGRQFPAEDDELRESGTFKVVYTGSVRKANRLDLLIDAASLIEDDRIRILIWGGGDELDGLHDTVRRRGLKNVAFKGRVDKKQIPAILMSADALFLDPFDEAVSQYGISSNKLFEYFAAGKPILMCRLPGHNPAGNYRCSITYEISPEGVAAAIRKASALSQGQREEMQIGALNAARAYSYDALSEKLNSVLEEKP